MNIKIIICLQHVLLNKIYGYLVRSKTLCNCQLTKERKIFILIYTICVESTAENFREAILIHNKIKFENL